MTDEILKKLDKLESLISLSQPQKWLNVKRASEYIGISESKLRKLIASGEIPFNKADGRILFHVRKLDLWILSGGKTHFSKSDKRLLEVIE